MEIGEDIRFNIGTVNKLQRKLDSNKLMHKEGKLKPLFLFLKLQNSFKLYQLSDTSYPGPELKVQTNKNPENDTKNTNNRIQLKELNDFIIDIPVHSDPEIIIIKYLIYNTLAFNQLACSAIFVPPKRVHNLV